MPGHTEMKKKAKKVLGNKGSRTANQLVKKAVNKARQAIKAKAMENKKIKQVAKAVPKPLKKLAQQKSRKAMKMLMI
jgi:phage-related minor tail protein